HLVLGDGADEVDRHVLDGEGTAPVELSERGEGEHRPDALLAGAAVPGPVLALLTDVDAVEPGRAGGGESGLLEPRQLDTVQLDRHVRARVAGIDDPITGP